MKSKLIFILMFILISGACGKKFFNKTTNARQRPFPAAIKKQSSVLFKDKVNVINIVINKTLYRNHVLRGSRLYSHAASFSFNGKIIKNVGIRIRGSHWARRLAKKQYKIKFNAVRMRTGETGILKKYSSNKGRRFFGLTKFNLRCNPDNDPSLIVDKLTSEVFQAVGAPYPKIGFAKVSVNGKNAGMYLITEHPDSTFLKMNFGNSKGNFFKARWSRRKGASFYPGSYSSGRYKITKKLNGQYDVDIKDFMTRLSLVKNYKDFAELLNVEKLVAYWTASNLAGHWDSIIGNMANDRIFHNAADGKWYLVGWDGDNSFGIGERNNWGRMCFTSRAPLYNAMGSMNKSLIFNKAHQIKQIYGLYVKKMKEMLDKAFNKDMLMIRLSKLQQLIEPHLVDEPGISKLNKEGFSYAIQQLKEYVKIRYNYLKKQFKQ